MAIKHPLPERAAAAPEVTILITITVHIHRDILICTILQYRLCTVMTQVLTHNNTLITILAMDTVITSADITVPQRKIILVTQYLMINIILEDTRILTATQDMQMVSKGIRMEILIRMDLDLIKIKE